MDTIGDDVTGRSEKLVKTEIEPFTVVDAVSEPLPEAAVYASGAYRAAVLGLDEDITGLSKHPQLYMLIENGGDTGIQVRFDNPPRESYAEILESWDKPDYVEINGQRAAAVMQPTFYERIQPGSKGIVRVEIRLENEGLTLEAIETLKREFVIENGEFGEGWSEALGKFTVELP